MAHDPQIKAQVMGALLAGQGVAEVAKQFGLDKSVVSRWSKKIPLQKLQQIATQKQQNFEELILEYVGSAVRALQAQVEEASRPEYIKKQSASELATLHGIVADKLFRILSALEPVQDEPQPPISA